MTMENQELNKRIMKNVRNKIVVSNLEREESMKLRARKRVISMCAVAVILLSGSLLSVNAATDGKLVEDIKEKYEEIVVVKLNKDNYTVTKQKDEKGEEHEIYNIKATENNIESKIECDINKDVLQDKKMQLVVEEEGENSNSTIIDYENEECNILVTKK